MARMIRSPRKVARIRWGEWEKQDGSWKTLSNINLRLSQKITEPFRVRKYDKIFNQHIRIKMG